MHARDCGADSTGKTHVVETAADILFGDRNAVIKIDCAEFQHSHEIAKLIGSPPGYVGYEEGGQLTERVKRNPYSVILLDEIEKAHPDVYNILLQVFEDGHLTDGLGNTIDFKNNKFYSAELKKKGFAEVAYEEDSRRFGPATFSANMTSEKEGKAKWTGTAVASARRRRTPSGRPLWSTAI